jgi:hypothetical protein
MKPVAAIPEPNPDELGPKMLALELKQRKFVLAYLRDARDASRCARAAGYSSSSGADRVTAHRLLRNPRVVEAIKEEADRTLNSNAYIAVAALADIAADPEHKDRFKAADSILDRTGFPKTTVHAVTTDEENSKYDNVSTAELIRSISAYAKRAWPEVVRPDGSVDVDKVLARAKIGALAELVDRKNGRAIDGDFAEVPAMPSRIDAGSTSRIYEGEV